MSSPGGEQRGGKLSRLWPPPHALSCTDCLAKAPLLHIRGRVPTRELWETQPLGAQVTSLAAASVSPPLTLLPRRARRLQEREGLSLCLCAQNRPGRVATCIDTHPSVHLSREQPGCHGEAVDALGALIDSDPPPPCAWRKALPGGWGGALGVFKGQRQECSHRGRAGQGRLRAQTVKFTGSASLPPAPLKIIFQVKIIL